ncbi:MAG: hypothetical protein U1F48_19070 [Burkholderiales bacterium]
MSGTLSSLLQCEVVHEDGTALGRVFDCRCRGRPGARGGAPVVMLVYGMPGWLERLGLRSTRTCEVAWRDVLRIDGGRIVVRAPRR